MTTPTTDPSVGQPPQVPVPAAPTGEPYAPVPPAASQAPTPGTPTAAYHGAGAVPAPPVEVTEERVGRGMLFAVGAVVLGVALAGLLGWVGRFGMLGAWVASVGAVMGYAFGASGFRKGKFGVLGLMVLGTALSIVANIFGEFMKFYADEKAKGGEQLDEPMGLFFAILPTLLTDKASFGLIALSLVGFAFGLWRWFKFVMAHRQPA